MVCVVIHIHSLWRIDIELKSSLHTRELAQSLTQCFVVFNISIHSPKQRHRSHRVFDIHPAGDTERATLDDACRGYDIVEIVTTFQQLYIASVEVALLVIRVAIDRNSIIRNRHIDTLFDNQHATLLYLCNKLRESLLDLLVSAVDIEVVGICRSYHRSIGIELQERTVELICLNDKPIALAQHQVRAEILGYTAQEG